MTKLSSRYAAALRKCSTNCCAGFGSALKLRAQMASLRWPRGRESAPC